MRKFAPAFICFFSASLLFVGCNSPAYKAGDVYSVDTGEEKFSIVKVLAVEPAVIHIRVYKEKFTTRPKEVDTKKLSLGSPNDPDGFGVGHIPLELNAFKEWEPELIKNEPVTDEELEGYRMYMENMK